MIKLVIDPGHGGEDPGATGSGLEEKDLNLEISRRVAGKLSAYDVTTALTRTGDVDLSLKERYDYANNLQAEYFCSIHINAGGGSGFESYIHINAPERSEILRNVLHETVAGYYVSNGFTDRGKKRANFAVLRETVMPAVLLENLFIDSRDDTFKLKDDAFLDGLAGAIAGGLAAALEIPRKWDPAAEITKLKTDGLINSGHLPDDPVTWGEMATVLNRLRGK